VVRGPHVKGKTATSPPSRPELFTAGAMTAGLGGERMENEPTSGNKERLEKLLGS
jgi:hypothetical protein